MLMQDRWVHGRLTARLKSKQFKLYVSGDSVCNKQSHTHMYCTDCDAVRVETGLYYGNELKHSHSFSGEHANIIVPPTWIIKLPRHGSFKSSLRKTPQKKSASKKKSKGLRAFNIKPIPTLNVTPVLVFINPKSGGNQVSSPFAFALFLFL